MSEIYISIDCETSGPCPGLHDLLSFGAAAFDAPHETPIDTFYATLKPVTNVFAHDTFEWWNKPEQAAAWDALHKNQEDVDDVLPRFNVWLTELKKKYGSITAVAYPAGFDFTWLYWHLHRYGGGSPLGFSCLDIKSYAAAALGLGYRKTVKTAMPAEWFDSNRPHTHNALDDAIEQGVTFLRIRRSVQHLGE